MADLDKKARDALPDDDFAVPSKRKLPIHDATHAKLAWDMVNRTKDLSSDERQEAQERIKQKADSLGVDTSDWHLSASVHFEAMALNMPDVGEHPNKMPFTGVLTRIDQISDLSPGGAKGKQTLIPKDVAETALPTLLGMGVDCTANFDGHDAKQKIGLITGAEIVGDAIEIEGYFYAKDFPETCKKIRAEKGALGFSFEADARIQDAKADIWTVEHCVFTGAAVLYKKLAAYQTTSLSASAEKDLQMSKEILEAIAALAASVATVQTGIEATNKEVAAIKASASLGGAIVDQVKPHVDALNSCADAMSAAGIGNDPRAGHIGVIRNVAAHMAAAAVSGNIPKIYRDHDYLPNASVQASAEDKAAADKAAADLKAMAEKVAAQDTQITDLKAAAFNSSKEPERKTLAPQILSLLAKGNIKPEDVGTDGKVTVAQFDVALSAAGISGHQAMAAKIRASQDGSLKY